MSGIASDSNGRLPEDAPLFLAERRLHPYAIITFWKRPSRPAWLSFSLLARVLLLVAVTTAIVLTDAGRSTLSDRVDNYQDLPPVDLFEDLDIVEGEDSPAAATESEPGITITVSSVGAAVALVVMLLALIGGVIGANLLAWWRIRYGIEDGVFWMSGGVIRPWRRIIPLDNIQVADFSASLIEQVLRVRVLRIESAAPTVGPDILLTGVRAKDAAAIREVFEARWGTADRADWKESPEAAMSIRDLLIAGATSLEVGRAIAFLTLAGLVLRRFSPSLSDRLTTFDVTIEADSVSGFARDLGTLILAFGALWLLTTILFAINFSRHRLQRRGALVEVNYGRITQRWRMIPPGRVQSLLVTENMLQQLLGLKTLRVAIAGDSRGGSEVSILLPTSRARTLAPVIEAIVPSHTMPVGVLTGQDLRSGGYDDPPYIIRATLLRCAPLVVLIWLLLDQATNLSPWWALSVLTPVIPLIGYRLWQDRDAAWLVEQAERLVTRERRIGRITICAPFDRVQLATVNQSFLQRRSGEGSTFDAATPGAASTWLERKLMVIFKKPPEVHLMIPSLELGEASTLQRTASSSQQAASG